MKAAKKILLSLAFTVPAFAQTNATYLLISSNTVSPSSPMTTIGVWATWTDPATQFIIGRSDYDLTAGDGVFSNPANVIFGPNSSTGVITGNVITGGVNGQLWVPFGWFNRDNPVLLATYEWTTSNFSPRAVGLHTSNTSYFGLWIPNAQQFVELYPDEFTPGSGVIIVEGNCYADCDGSGMLDIFDFLCFQNSFVNGEPYACDCDTSTGTNPPVCDIFDFLCFQNAFVAGCP